MSKVPIHVTSRVVYTLCTYTATCWSAFQSEIRWLRYCVSLKSAVKRVKWCIFSTINLDTFRFRRKSLTLLRDDIYIRDDLGEKISFDSGKVIVTLHFRK